MTAWIVRLHEHDTRALHALVLRRRPRLDGFMRAVTHLGDAVVTIGLTLGMLLGWTPGGAVAGRRAAFALAGSHLVVQLLKRSIGRRRPELPTGVLALAQPPDRFSFPSGHAASSLSVGLAMAFALGSPLGALVVLLAMVVGLSRCYLGVHFPGDVVAGWTLAILGTVGAMLLLG